MSENYSEVQRCHSELFAAAATRGEELLFADDRLRPRHNGVTRIDTVTHFSVALGAHRFGFLPRNLST